jgi:hypothetical protein
MEELTYRSNAVRIQSYHQPPSPTSMTGQRPPTPGRSESLLGDALMRDKMERQLRPCITPLLLRPPQGLIGGATSHSAICCCPIITNKDFLGQLDKALRQTACLTISSLFLSSSVIYSMIWNTTRRHTTIANKEEGGGVKL